MQVLDNKSSTAYAFDLIISTANTSRITWPRRLCHVTNALLQSTKLPLFQSKENATSVADQGILSCFSSKVSTTATASILYCFTTMCQKVEGEKCTCLHIQVCPLNCQHSKLVMSTFQVFKSNQRGSWYESPPSWEDGYDVSWLWILNGVRINFFLSQVWLETTQAKSWKAWAVSLVWMWSCQDSSTSLWWNLPGEQDWSRRTWNITSIILTES